MKNHVLLVSLCAVLCTYAVAQQPHVVHTFVCTNPQDQGPCPLGGSPTYLILASDGNFYGTAQRTATATNGPQGGVVFSLTPSGVFKVIYKFSNVNNYTKGSNPSRLLEGPDGLLYGETSLGGANQDGVLFRLNRNGTGYQVLYNFCTSESCPSTPEAFVNGNDGNIYGTTYYGGDVSCGFNLNCGTIFRVTPSTGELQVVFNFGFTSSGENPSTLVIAPDGTFYGTTISANGTVLFHYTESTGDMQTTVLDFPPQNGEPVRGNVSALGPNGNLYGLYTIEETEDVGLFEVQLDGSNLQEFPLYSQDSDTFTEGLVLGSDGNFWMAQFGGAAGWGQILTFSPTNGSRIQTLSPFGEYDPAGAYPVELFSTPAGTLWGVSSLFGKAPKGSYGGGVLFTLTPKAGSR